MTDFKRTVDWAEEDDESSPPLENQVEHLPDGTKRVTVIIDKKGDKYRTVYIYRTITRTTKEFPHAIERQRRMKERIPFGKVISEPCISIGEETNLIKPPEEIQSNKTTDIDKQISKLEQKVKISMNSHNPTSISANISNNSDSALFKPRNQAGENMGNYGLQRDNSNDIKISNIPSDVSEDDLRALFRRCGDILRVNIITDRKTGVRIGHAYITYRSIDEAEKAVKVLHKHGLNHMILEVELQKPRGSSTPAPTTGKYVPPRLR